MATFKAKARALDMLGRQQIAGIPTAIAELFKNAHDAYADRVEVDFFRTSRLFLLRDDGVGMTSWDIKNRWLALGTESKVESPSNPLPPLRDSEKAPRPILGEKGIGRLAVAVLGPQVLLLTRAKLIGEPSPLVAAFVHWGMFEIPGIDLDQVQVPVHVFRGGSLPSRSNVLTMVREVRDNLDSLRNLVDPERAERLSKELDSFDVDPGRFDGYLNGPRLAGEGHGTHLYIKPASELLEADIEVEDSANTAPPLTKLLVGFTNTMTPNHPPPVIATSFRDHTSTESYTDLIRERNFFTPEEFAMADHHIVGTFDEQGTFRGEVTVYGEHPREHTVIWPRGRGRPTRCGSFAIEVAYVPGSPRDSKLPREDHARLVAKLNRLGGLYLYRDGIRILPYGDTDYDWLGMEKRRTYGAAYYYFSYRRLFGAVEITREENSALQEKAGREGFRENAAYREFRGILENFFIQTAATFFRQGGPKSELFEDRRYEIQRVESIRRERDRQGAAERNELQRRLSNLSRRISQGQPHKSVEDILNRASHDASRVSDELDADRKRRWLIDVETHANGELQSLRDSYVVERPTSFGLTRELSRDLEAYQYEVRSLEEEIFTPAEARLGQIIESVAHSAGLKVSDGNRAASAIRSLTDRSRRMISEEISGTEQALRAATQRLQSAAQHAESEIGRASKLALERLDENQHTKRDVVVGHVGGEISAIVRDVRRELTAAREQLRNIPGNSLDGLATVSPLETLAVIEEELLALREQSDEDSELVQIGTAVLVINHEFSQTVSTIRRNVRELKAWADANPDLMQLYRELSAAFEHLDGYLTLFTPLQRRLYRKAVPIKGVEIYEYLRSLFAERLQREEVTLEATPEFRRKQIVGFPSTFYPVFVNLVDNALFWLQDVEHDRILRLHADGEGFLVEDNGPGIADRDREIIFEPGFTRKPGGRGLGLFISRSALLKSGYSLEVLPRSGIGGASFRIAPIDSD